jgi:hypothetical protein
MTRRPTTQLQRAFAVFEKMNPQLGSAIDLADWMNVPQSCAYTYIARLKALVYIHRATEGARKHRAAWSAIYARPLYGLPVDEASGAVIVKRPPDDSRGKWRRYAREVLQTMGDELMADGAPKS